MFYLNYDGCAKMDEEKAKNVLLSGQWKMILW